MMVKMRLGTRVMFFITEKNFKIARREIFVKNKKDTRGGD